MFFMAMILTMLRPAQQMYAARLQVRAILFWGTAMDTKLSLGDNHRKSDDRKEWNSPELKKCRIGETTAHSHGAFSDGGGSKSNHQS
jgi:hypothetical protein